MIFFLAKKEHARMQYVSDWGESQGSRMQFLFYEDLPAAHGVRPGTYIFADLETLSRSQLQLANELCGQLTWAGNQIRILNHPARALRRYALLCRLYEGKINLFRAVRACDSPESLRFPVFIRREDDHGGNLTRLLHNQGELRRMLKYVRLQGHRPGDLLVEEFCDTSDNSGIFRKYSAFVVGDQILPRHVIFSRAWNLKHPDLIDDALSEEKREYLEGNPHQRFLTNIFKIANIEYGRIDYSLAGDVPQVWEINTHPTVLQLTPRLTAAFEAIDGPDDDDIIPVSFDPNTLRRIRRENRRLEYNRGLRSALSAVASAPVLKKIKGIVKTQLA